MAFDKDQPSGSSKISAGDNSIRANNAALETALDLEHEFSTGGSQRGYHKFTPVTAATLNGISPNPPTGAIGLDTSTGPGAVIWRYFNGSTWAIVDCGSTNIGRIDAAKLWSTVQYSFWTPITVSGGALAVSYTSGPSISSSLPAGALTTISNPTNTPSGTNCATTYLKLTNAGAGSTLAWGNEYVSANGVTPDYDDTSGAINLYTITRLGNASYLVSASPAIGSF